MKKIYNQFIRLLLLTGVFLLFSNQMYSQFGCSSGVVITNGYTQMGITTPGTGGIEDWNVNPTGTSITASYWDDDVYLFEYTAGSTVEEISMTIFTRNSWNGIGIFDDCTGNEFSNELDASGSSSSSNISQTVSAVITAGNTVYIAVGQWGSPNDLDFDVTDFTVVPIQCSAPTALTATNLTPTTADIEWTENGTATTWDIEWGAASFTPTGTPTIAGTSSNPYPLSGLTSGASYDFYVRADCGVDGFSDWAGPYSFTTPLLVSPPLIEGFTTTTTPAGWDRTGWTIGSTRGVTGNPGNNIYKNIWSSGTTGSSFTTSAVGPVTANMIFSFDYIIANYSSPYDPPAAGSGDFVVEVSTDFGATYTTVETVVNNGVSGWQSKVYPLTAFAGQNVKLRITGNWISGDYDLAFDNFFVDLPPTCPDPSSLTATNITDNSADLGWTENGTATTWDIEWGAAGFTPTGTPTIAGTSSNPYSLSGLTGNSSYDFYVRADCGVDGASYWAGPHTFTTPCVAIAAPWLDDVELHTPTTNLGDSQCWTTSSQSTFDWNIDGNGSTPSTGTGPSGAYSGTNYFYVEATNGSSGDEAYLVSPVINVNALTNPALFFYYHMFGGDMGDLYIDVYDGTTWTNGVASIIGEQQTSATDPWLQQIVNLNGYTGDIQVRFRAVKGVNFESDISIDDIAINEAPSCFDPTNLIVASMTATTANLEWTENGTATAWDIEWGSAGFTPTGTPTNAGVTSNPYPLSGLTAETSYDFYVRADCGTDGFSNWSGPYSFTTPCATIVAPWSEDFENAGVIPDCWSQGAANAEDWKFANTPGSNHIGNNGTIVGASASGGYFAWVDDSSPDNMGTTLESPLIDVSGLTVPLLSFYLISDNEGYTNVDFSVDVWDGAAWNKVFISNSNTLNGGWEKIEVYLTSLTITGPIQLRFIVDETNGSDFYDDVAIDDVSVIEAPTCPAPSLLTATNTTATTADLGWQENGSATAWDIEYGPTGFTPSGTPSVSVTLNPYTLTGLNPITEYDYYVRANCGVGDLSLWTGPLTFQTECTGPLSGTYTIGATGDYATIKAAAVALNACGISGPVTFDVLTGSGPFNEQVVINEIVGASATNTITFNGNGETLTAMTSASERSLILLDGADYVTIDNLNLVTQSADNNFVIQLANNADFNTITGNTIDMTSTFGNTGTTNAGIVVSGSLTSATSSTVLGGTDNTFTNNTIIGGYYGLTINGESSTNNSLNNIISNNVFEDFRQYGMYLRSITNATISNNDISQPTRTNPGIFYGIYFLTSGENNLVEANKIHGAHTGDPNTTSSSYGIYHSSVDATMGNENRVINNTLYNITGNGLIYALYNSGSDGVYYYHNTISLDNPNATAGTTRGLYQTSAATNIDFKNNIITITRGGTGTKHALYFNTSTSVITSDYNILYVNAPAGTNSIGYSGSSQATLADWQTATSGDANSVDIDPILANPSGGQLSPTNAAVDNIGTPLGVLTDIDGNSRSTTTPDIGAYEFTPPTCLQPSALTATNITNSSADLGWNENGTASVWDIEWGTAGFTPTGTPTIGGTTFNPQSITGLTGNTSYDFYVRADCGSGDLSQWSGPYTFTTECDAVVAPWSEDFENNGSIPDCWSSSSSVSNGWTFATSPSNGNNYSDHTSGSGYFAFAEASSTYTPDATMLTPLIDISGLIDPKLEFYVYHYDNNSSTTSISNSLTVEVHDGANWNQVYFDDNGDVDAWEKVEVDLTTLTITGNIQVRFIVDATVGSNFYNDIGIDDVAVIESFVCPDPSGLTANNLTTSSAELEWTENGSATTWDIEWGTSGFIPTGTPTIAGVTTNPYLLTGLAHDTIYDFYVRADCGSLQSNWVGPFTFETLQVVCDAPTALTEDDVTDTTVDISWTASATETGGYAWYVFADGDDPLVDPSLFNGTVATGVTTVTITGLSPETEYDIYVSTFCDQAVESSLAGPLNVLTNPEPCEAPSNLVLVDIGETTLEISWTLPVNTANVEGYGWRIMNQGDDPLVDPAVAEDFVAGATSTTTIITGLTADTPYDIYLVAVCDLLNEYYSDPLMDTFTTDATFVCEMPSNVTLVDVDVTTAEFSWTASPTESNGYEWAVMANGENPATDTPVQSGTVATGITSVVVTGLDEETNYDFYVRTDCDPNGMSDWEGPYNFTTDQATSVNDFDISSIEFYPNPMDHVVNISAQVELEKVVIYSLTGQKLIETNIDGLTTQIDVSNFASGPYLMYVTTATGKSATYRLIKK